VLYSANHSMKARDQTASRTVAGALRPSVTRIPIANFQLQHLEVALADVTLLLHAPLHFQDDPC
jgi:hypothetical protein